MLPCFIVVLLGFLSQGSEALPVHTEDVPLEIQVLQNSKLFGGDMVGYIPKPHFFRNALPNDLQLWPNGVIPFVIDSSLAHHREIIYKAMNNYYENTCIKFIPRTTEYDYVNITKDRGCYSNVGRAGGMQIVSLGDGCHFVGTAVHELGHSVGFFHEHQRADRDTYLEVHPENIKADSMDQFDKMKPNEERIFVSYDYNSVMHYGSTAFTKNGKVTMNPIKSSTALLEVFQKYGLSKSDILAVKKLYRCL